MKKFILKTLAFVLPVFFLTLPGLFYYTDKGDLIRVGYILDVFNYRSIFKNELNDTVLYYDNISTINLNKKTKYTVLTIGDSFSKQRNIGYQNYLAKNNDVKVLHYNAEQNDNLLSIVHGIVNGNLLDSIQVDFIILQSVERLFVSRSTGVKYDTIILADSLKFEKTRNWTDENKNKFFSDRGLIASYYNICYLLDDNAFTSEVYRCKTKTELFSGKRDVLLLFLLQHRKPFPIFQMGFLLSCWY